MKEGLGVQASKWLTMKAGPATMLSEVTSAAEEAVEMTT
jgi:hypothetical protein